MKPLFWLSFLFGILMSFGARADLIVLAAPLTGDPYYADQADRIFDFHVGFARRIAAPDDVLILVDEPGYDRYAAAIGRDRVAPAPMPDIWLRDFGTANAAAPVMFRYTAAGQGGGPGGQAAADRVQDALTDLASRAALKYESSELLNDGGNFVDDYSGNAVVSRKFLRDNGLSEDEGRRRLRRLTGIRHVAFIDADEQGGLEHADGVVAFIDTNTLLVNSYPDDPEYARDLKADLRRGLPGVEIVEVVTPYDDSEVLDERFGSACGLYTNALVTRSRIYLPQFGLSEDRIALETVRAATRRQVVGVAAHQVCFMGGGVRCMSWQVRGPSADRLRALFD